MTGDISGFNAANFVLPTAPAGDTYSLQVVSGGVDLVVAAVPEPGTLALFRRWRSGSAGRCLAAAESRLRAGKDRNWTIAFGYFLSGGYLLAEGKGAICFLAFFHSFFIDRPSPLRRFSACPFRLETIP